MLDFREKLVPFKGTSIFSLYGLKNEICNILDTQHISYTTEIWSNEECTNPVPWTIIRIQDGISLFFANGKLWKIYIVAPFKAELSNGVKIGMSMEDAQKTDSTLTYDDWNEVWTSDLGYWIEDDLDDDTVMSISVFIPEVLNDEVFDKYEW